MKNAAYMNSDTAAACGSPQVTLTSTATAWGPVAKEREDGVWTFSFSICGISEARADALHEEMMYLLCGGGAIRHSWLGKVARRLTFGRLGACKRFVVGSWRKR